MLPPFLFGSYKRYKSDTDVFTTWLAENAKRAGHHPKFDQAAVNSPYQVPLAEFTTLAGFVARASIEVPADIARTACRTLSARKKCSEWFSKTDDVDHDQTRSNETHNHFSTVLEATLEVLGVAASPESYSHPSQTNPTAATQDPFSDLTNRFLALDIDELFTGNDDDEDISQSGPISTKGKGRSNQRYEIEKLFENGRWAQVFACFCLLEDMRHIREFLQKTWTEYRDSHLDLMTVSVTANLAFDLTRILCDEFIKEHPSLCNAKIFSNLVYETGCQMRGEDPDRIFHPMDRYNVNVADIADWSLYRATDFLTYYLDYLKQHFGDNPGCPSASEKVDFFQDTADWRGDKAAMAERQRYNEDYHVTLFLFPDLMFLNATKLEFPVQDMLIRGWKKMLKTKEVPLWLAFALTVFLDIHRVLGSSSKKPSQELRFTALRAQKTLDRVSHISFDMARTIDRRWQGNLYLDTEWIKRIVIKDAFEIDRPEFRRHEEFQFFKMNPIICGLLVFEINLKMQKHGIFLVNAWASVLQFGYLHNLIHQTGYGSMPWEDLQKIFEFHDEDHLFMGGRPKTATETLHKMRLAVGHPPSMFALRGNNNKPFVIKRIRDKQRMIHPSSFLSGLDGRYKLGEYIDLSVDHVGQLLEELVATDSGIKGQNGNGKKPVSKSRELMWKKWSTSKSLSPLQLLVALRERLADEEPRLLFNYFELQQRCIDLLRQLRDSLDNEGLGAPELDELSSLWWVLLSLATVVENDSRYALQKKDDEELKSKVLVQTTEIMKKFLKDHGATGCKELKAFCTQKHKVMLEETSHESKEQDTLHWFALSEIYERSTLRPVKLVTVRVEKKTSK